MKVLIFMLSVIVFTGGCAQFEFAAKAAPIVYDRALAGAVKYLCGGARRGALERWLANDQERRDAHVVICR